MDHFQKHSQKQNKKIYCNINAIALQCRHNIRKKSVVESDTTTHQKLLFENRIKMTSQKQ